MWAIITTSDVFKQKIVSDCDINIKKRTLKWPTPPGHIRIFPSLKMYWVATRDGTISRVTHLSPS